MDGKLIVFEGVEGSGKTTQLARSHEWLQTQVHSLTHGTNTSQIGLSDAVSLTRQPGGTPLGGKLRQLLLETAPTEFIADRAELLLYAADRAQHVEAFLKPRLTQGQIVLCDRYTDSTIAYQGYGRGLSLSLIDQLNEIATNGLKSDLTLWLDVDVEIGLARARQRGSADRMEQAQLEFHRRVQQGYAELAQAYPDRIVRVDASENEAVVAAQIQQILSQSLAQWGMLIKESLSFDQ